METRVKSGNGGGTGSTGTGPVGPPPPESESDASGSLSSNNIARAHDIRKHSLAQMERLRILRQRLFVIQASELEEYTEQQEEAVTKTFSEAKGIKLPESGFPEFLKKDKNISFSEEDEQEKEKHENDLENKETEDPKVPHINKKRTLEEMFDANQIMKNNMKEIMLSTQLLGKEDYDTESDSDYEDEVEATASHRYHRNDQRFHGYLPVEVNPATSWSRMRHAAITRWVFLVDALRNMSYRRRQLDALLTHIKATKPQFKFEEKAEARKPVIVNPPANLKDITVHVFRKGSFEAQTASQYMTNQSIQKAHVLGGKTSIPLILPGQYRISQTPNGPVLQRNVISKEKEKSDEVYRDKIGGGLEQLNLTLEEPADRDPLSSSRRVMPVKAFRQRKVFQLGGIHNVIGKPVKKPTVLCTCFGRTELCAVCSGRSDKVKPLKNGAMTSHEILALLDHTYHKTLSTTEEKPVSRLIESALKTEEWKKPATKKHNPTDSDSDDDSYTEVDEDGNTYSLLLETARTRPSQISRFAKKRYQRRRKTDDKVVRPSTASKKPVRKRRKHDSDIDDDDLDDDELDWTPKRTKPTNQDPSKKRRVDGKYDIDHIVIPYSIAAATRVEKIEYKEILIPRWRINKILPMKRPPPNTNTPRLTRRRQASAPDVNLSEDVSEEAIKARHQRSESEEKKRFLAAVDKLSKKRARRSESKAECLESCTSGPESNDPIPIAVSKAEELISTPTHSNHISAAEASLAVTALKLASSRRRTISSKQEDEEIEEPGFTPFEPRKFPLDEEEYKQMEIEMEEAYKESELIAASCISDEPTKADEEGSDNSESDDPDWNESTKPDQPNGNGISITKSGRR